jgi:hypothetical protein
MATGCFLMLWLRVPEGVTGFCILQKSRLALGPIQPPTQWVPALFTRVKAVRI